MEQLERLRNEGLIEWHGDPLVPFEDVSWLEIQDCMVVSSAWSGVFIPSGELYDALRPYDIKSG